MISTAYTKAAGFTGSAVSSVKGGAAYVAGKGYGIAQTVTSLAYSILARVGAQFAGVGKALIALPVSVKLGGVAVLAGAYLANRKYQLTQYIPKMPSINCSLFNRAPKEDAAKV